MVRTWLEERTRRRGWKPKTAKTHEHRLARLYEHFGKTRLDSIRPRDVAAYIKQSLGERSAQSVIAEVNLLHDVLGRAVAEELLQSNPAALTHLALTPGASELLMATAGHRSFATTRRYLHLARRAFPEAAAALEDRFPAGTKLYPSEPISADLTAS